MDIEDFISGIFLAEVFYFINIAVNKGLFEIEFWVDFDQIIKDFEELNGLEGIEIFDIWEINKEISINFLKDLEYEVNIIKTHSPKVLIYIAF